MSRNAQKEVLLEKLNSREESRPATYMMRVIDARQAAEDTCSHTREDQTVDEEDNDTQDSEGPGTSTGGVRGKQKEVCSPPGVLSSEVGTLSQSQAPRTRFQPVGSLSSSETELELRENKSHHCVTQVLSWAHSVGTDLTETSSTTDTCSCAHDGEERQKEDMRKRDNPGTSAGGVSRNEKPSTTGHQARCSTPGRNATNWVMGRLESDASEVGGLSRHRPQAHAKLAQKRAPISKHVGLDSSAPPGSPLARDIPTRARARGGEDARRVSKRAHTSDAPREPPVGASP